MKRLAIAILCTAALPGQVTFERILQSAREPRNWLT
jgi:hypothetical protein